MPLNLSSLVPQTQQRTLSDRLPASVVNGIFSDSGYNSSGKPYVLMPGQSIGLDGNYKYAVYRDGHVEPAYQAPQGSEDTQDTYYTSSELANRGVDLANAPRDAHGVPIPAGYTPAGNPNPGPGGLGDALGLGAFTLMTMGLGSAAAAGAGAGAAGAGAAEGAGAGAGALGDAGVYGLSGIESAAAPGFTYGTASAGGTAAGTAAGTGVAAGAGPGEWADLSGWLGADASGAPAYDANAASLNSALTAGAGGTATTAGGTAAGAGGGVAAAGGGTALGRLLSGNGTTADYASLAGNLGIAGLGYYGASRQADSLAGIAAENRADRMPFYAKSLEYLNNPSAYASGPGQAALQANLRALSVNGNPADNPALLGIATSSALRDWRDAVTGFGNIGLSGSDTRASLMSGATNADANALNALGYGLGSTLNPPSTIEQLLKQLKGAGVGLA